MTVDLVKRAQALDKLRLRRIADKLTVEEAGNIVSVWGKYLEQNGGFRIIFGISTPESLLPYPLVILQAALNKMEAHHYEQGHHEKVKLLEETEALLMQYSDDEEALKELVANINNKSWIYTIVNSLKEYQKNQVLNGYLVDNKLWKLSKSRLDELLKG